MHQQSKEYMNEHRTSHFDRLFLNKKTRLSHLADFNIIYYIYYLLLQECCEYHFGQYKNLGAKNSPAGDALF